MRRPCWLQMLLTKADNPAYKHGMSGLPEHKVWIDMRQRCQNRNRGNFKFYGGRGITVCGRWNRSFLAFVEDMGFRPSPKHTIERIDNNGPYAPWNCKWATASEQRHNYSRNRWLKIDGRRQTIGDWASERGLDERLIRIRIRRGISERDAVMTPVQPNTGGKRRIVPQFVISK